MDTWVRLTCLVIIVFAMGSSAHAEKLGAWLERKDLAVEAAMRSRVIAYMAAGKVEEAQCLHEQYFGSPLFQRRLLITAWIGAEKDPLGSLLSASIQNCGQTLHPSDTALWGRAANETVVLDLAGSYERSMVAAASAFKAFAEESGEVPLADCIAKEIDVGVIGKIVNHNDGRLPISVAAHDLLRDRCGLNKGRPAAASLSLPAMPDVMVVARERLLIVQDLWACKGKAAEWCLSQRYDIRAKALRGPILLQSSGP